MQITVERDEKVHSGPACYRQHKSGTVTVMCPYGHYVDSIAPGMWGESVWSTRAAWGDDIVTCHGALKPDARPYPFTDTFTGLPRNLIGATDTRT